MFDNFFDHVLITDCGVLGGTCIQILWRWTKRNVWIWRTPIWVLYNGWYAHSLLPSDLSFSYINMHTNIILCTNTHILWTNIYIFVWFHKMAGMITVAGALSLNTLIYNSFLSQPYLCLLKSIIHTVDMTFLFLGLCPNISIIVVSYSIQWK